MTDLVKIFFELTQDEDGYPGLGAESVWGKVTDVSGEFTVDNIPFFVPVVTLGDIIRTRNVDGRLWFDRVIHRSTNSLIRIVFFDVGAFDRVNDALCSLGCLTEYSKEHKLLAVSIPKDVSLLKVQTLLGDEVQRGQLDYEEPILRDIRST